MSKKGSTGPGARALKAYVALMRAANAVTRRIHRHLDKHRLTVSQFGVLEALHHLGPLPQVELGRKILKSSNNITTVIDNLERRRLVERSQGERDRRIKQVRLTPEGDRLVADLFPRHSEIVRADFDILKPSEQKEFTRLCRKLGLGGDR